MSPAAKDDWYAQFTPTASFLEPCEIVGTIEHRETFKASDGLVPRYRIRLDNGRAVWVNATQARLLEEVIRHNLDIGDRVKITYKGPASKAAPGMSPAKEFVVVAKRPVPPSPET